MFNQRFLNARRKHERRSDLQLYALKHGIRTRQTTVMTITSVRGTPVCNNHVNNEMLTSADHNPADSSMATTGLVKMPTLGSRGFRFFFQAEDGIRAA